jgi:hypothetical protein
MTIKEFNVGEIVYLLDFHYRSSLDGATIKEVTVVSVANKYVTVDVGYSAKEKFYVNNEKTDMFLTAKDSTNILFHSKEDYIKYIEYIELDKWFHRDLKYKDLTLDQLRAIKQIAESE